MRFTSAMISYLLFAVAMILISNQMNNSQIARGKAERLVAISRIAHQDYADERPLRASDFAMYTRSGWRQISRKYPSATYGITSAMLQGIGISANQLPSGSEATILTHDANRPKCHVIAVKAEIGTTVYDLNRDIFDVAPVSAFSPKAIFFDASDCFPDLSVSVSGVAFKAADGAVHLYLPKDFFHRFPRFLVTDAEFRDIGVHLVDNVGFRIIYKRYYSPLMKRFFDKANSYIMVSLSGIDQEIISLAQQATGKSYSQNELPSAIFDIFSSTNLGATVAGLTAAPSTLILFWPIATSVLLWIALRSASAEQRRVSPEFWLATDVSDFIGKLVALAFSLLAPLLTIYSAVSYYAIERIYGHAFGYVWWISPQLYLKLIPFSLLQFNYVPNLEYILVGFVWIVAFAVSVLLYIKLLSVSADASIRQRR